MDSDHAELIPVPTLKPHRGDACERCLLSGPLLVSGKMFASSGKAFVKLGARNL